MLPVVYLILFFALSIATWIYIGKNNEIKDNSQYVKVYIYLLITSITNVLQTCCMSINSKKDEKKESNLIENLVKIAPLAMWIWGWIIIAGSSGFDFDEFKNNYTALGRIVEMWQYGYLSSIIFICIIPCAAASN